MSTQKQAFRNIEDWKDQFRACRSESVMIGMMHALGDQRDFKKQPFVGFDYEAYKAYVECLLWVFDQDNSTAKVQKSALLFLLNVFLGFTHLTKYKNLILIYFGFIRKVDKSYINKHNKRLKQLLRRLITEVKEPDRVFV